MNSTRRVFLQRSLAATGALAAAPTAWGQWGRRRRAAAIPPHRSQTVAGVHLYASHESAAPGELVSFQVSSDVPVQARIYRLGTSVDHPASDLMLEDFGQLQAGVQPIHPGSYVHIPKGLSGDIRSFSIEAWVRPWRTDRLMGVVSQEDKASAEGWALGLGKDGYVGFYLGDGVSEDDRLVHRTATGGVQRGRWHHLVGTWDGRQKAVWIDGRKVADWDFAGPLKPGPHSIRLGAMGENGETTHFLDGDLAMVVLRNSALDEPALLRRFSERGAVPGEGSAVKGCWAFDEEKGERVGDRSSQRRHGRIINHGTWMIGGPSFDASVPRFGGYDPSTDSTRGHGLRLASDDLYDCRWDASLSWRVPPTARSGFYVLRLNWERNSQAFYQHATFVVRRRPGRRPAPLLLLAATNTWRAYNAAAFGQVRPGARQLCGTDGLPNSPGDPPAFSYYRNHAAGQGTYQVGARMPWPAAGPYLRYGDVTDYSHLARADRFAQTWLEREGYDYEIISDRDLHENPGRLRRHRVFLINGHSEYWSKEMYQGLEEYLGAGGKVMVLSGNSLFWRVTYSPDGSVMECRKVDAPGDQLRPEQRGEAWHSHDSARGGMMRECGFPGWRLIGLETLGWNNQGDPRNFGPWTAERVDHPIFHTPEETGLKSGDEFGWAGSGQLPMGNGHEFDVRLSTLASMAAGPVPPGASMPVDPPGIRRIANGIIPWEHGGAAFDYFFRPIKPANQQGGEMIWWERPEGGTVFNAGSIGAGWALQADPKWSALLRNVLHHFGVSRDGTG